MVEITDRESLEAWLVANPYGAGMAIQVAVRCALRAEVLAFDVASIPRAANGDVPWLLKFFRPILAAGCCAASSDAEIRRACTVAALVVAERTETSGAVAASAAFSATVSRYRSSVVSTVSESILASVHLVPDFASEMLRELNRDLGQKVPSGEWLVAPLWGSVPEQYRQNIDAILAEMRRSPNSDQWRFWIDWLKKTSAGHQQDWHGLLKDIALISDPIWSAGVVPVAEQIAILEEIYSLRSEVEKLSQENSVTRLSIASEQQRSHNRPPGLVDVKLEPQRVTAVLSNLLEEAREELNQPAPRAGALERIGSSIMGVITEWAAYSAGLADVVLKEAAKTVGSTGAKVLIGAGALNMVLSQNSNLSQFAERLIELAQRLP